MRIHCLCLVLALLIAGFEMAPSKLTAAETETPSSAASAPPVYSVVELVWRSAKCDRHERRAEALRLGLHSEPRRELAASFFFEAWAQESPEEAFEVAARFDRKFYCYDLKQTSVVIAVWLEKDSFDAVQSYVVGHEISGHPNTVRILGELYELASGKATPQELYLHAAQHAPAHCRSIITRWLDATHPDEVISQLQSLPGVDPAEIGQLIRECWPARLAEEGLPRAVTEKWPPDDIKRMIYRFPPEERFSQMKRHFEFFSGNDYGSVRRDLSVQDQIASGWPLSRQAEATVLATEFARGDAEALSHFLSASPKVRMELIEVWRTPFPSADAALESARQLADHFHQKHYGRFVKASFWQKDVESLEDYRRLIEACRTLRPDARRVALEQLNSLAMTLPMEEVAREIVQQPLFVQRMNAAELGHRWGHRDAESARAWGAEHPDEDFRQRYLEALNAAAPDYEAVPPVPAETEPATESETTSDKLAVPAWFDTSKEADGAGGHANPPSAAAEDSETQGSRPLPDRLQRIADAKASDFPAIYEESLRWGLGKRWRGLAMARWGELDGAAAWRWLRNTGRVNLYDDWEAKCLFWGLGCRDIQGGLRELQDISSEYLRRLALLSTLIEEHPDLAIPVVKEATGWREAAPVYALVSALLRRDPEVARQLMGQIPRSSPAWEGAVHSVAESMVGEGRHEAARDWCDKIEMVPDERGNYSDNMSRWWLCLFFDREQVSRRPVDVVAENRFRSSDDFVRWATSHDFGDSDFYYKLTDVPDSVLRQSHPQLRGRKQALVAYEVGKRVYSRAELPSTLAWAETLSPRHSNIVRAALLETWWEADLPAALHWMSETRPDQWTFEPADWPIHPDTMMKSLINSVAHDDATCRLLANWYRELPEATVKSWRNLPEPGVLFDAILANWCRVNFADTASYLEQLPDVMPEEMTRDAWIRKFLHSCAFSGYEFPHDRPTMRHVIRLAQHLEDGEELTANMLYRMSWETPDVVPFLDEFPAEWRESAEKRLANLCLLPCHRMLVLIDQHLLEEERNHHLNAVIEHWSLIDQPSAQQAIKSSVTLTDEERQRLRVYPKTALPKNC